MCRQESLVSQFYAQSNQLSVSTVNPSPGYYVYTEGTGVSSGSIAVLVSPTLNWNSPSTCVTFWYSMMGSQIGTLVVEAVSAGRGGSSQTATVWSRAGSQGTGWHQASVTVHTSSPVQVGQVIPLQSEGPDPPSGSVV